MHSTRLCNAVLNKIPLLSFAKISELSIKRKKIKRNEAVLERGPFAKTSQPSRNCYFWLWRKVLVAVKVILTFLCMIDCWSAYYIFQASIEDNRENHLSYNFQSYFQSWKMWTTFFISVHSAQFDCMRQIMFLNLTMWTNLMVKIYKQNAVRYRLYIVQIRHVFYSTYSKH
jgi:hypothetical protein